MLTREYVEQNVFNKINKDDAIKEQVSNILQCSITICLALNLILEQIRNEDKALCCKKVSSQYNRL